MANKVSPINVQPEMLGNGYEITFEGVTIRVYTQRVPNLDTMKGLKTVVQVDVLGAYITEKMGHVSTGHEGMRTVVDV